MSREPECRCAMDTDAHTPGHCHWCICAALRAAYRRGRDDERARIKAAAQALPKVAAFVDELAIVRLPHVLSIIDGEERA